MDAPINDKNDMYLRVMNVSGLNLQCGGEWNREGGVDKSYLFFVSGSQYSCSNLHNQDEDEKDPILKHKLSR